MGHPQGAHHAPVNVRVYIMVAIALVFLTACSYWTYTPFWPFGDSVAIKRLWMMAVSCTKAMLVILFFMHLKWEANWKWLVTVPASMMSLLLILALVPDVGLRMRHASHERLIHAAEQREREAAGKPGTALKPAEHPVGE
ncbi:MAG: cytochrome C oxidase subunit IV family protein [Pirellulales bacterium]|nr:cytochrome C oxidase subunit IV family protein [Pirellulales bacterium]